MKDKKKKGYALAIVIILIFVMTVVVLMVFNILMRYMFFARDNLQSLGEGVAFMHFGG